MYNEEITIPVHEGVCTINTGAYFDELIRQHGAKNAYGVKLLIGGWVTLLADSPCGLKPARLIRRFFKQASEDLFGTIRSLSKLGDDISKSLVETESGVTITHFIDEFKTSPLMREYLTFINNFDGNVLQYIMSFCYFAKKLFYTDPDLDTTAFRKWLETEARLEELVLEDEALLSRLKDVVSAIFEDYNFDLMPLLPKHGSGRVSEEGIWGSNLKNLGFTLPPKLGYLLSKRPKGNMQDYLPHYPLEEWSEHDWSRLKFVPKTWKTSRSICMEPISFQWAQQAVRLWVEQAIKDGFLYRYVRIEDQRHNQRASEFGSLTGYVDTIDLSAASDSVSWDLIKRVFPAKVTKYLAATRTKRILASNGELIEVKKFAPMGSALCFPVQSIIYCSVILDAMIQHSVPELRGCSNYGDANRIIRLIGSVSFEDLSFERNKLQPPRVYGDDLICDSRITSDVVRTLKKLGFLVNEEKSFTGNQAYRESCGTHHFGGVEVTPYVYKVKNVGPKLDPRALLGIIEHANSALEFRYLNLRRYLKNVAMYYPVLNKPQDSLGRNQVLFTNDPDVSGALLVTGVARNTHLKRRVALDTTTYRNGSHIDYQRDEVRSIGVTAKERVELSEKFDNYGYVLWQRSRYYPHETSDLVSEGGNVDARGVRLVWRWTPD